MTNTNGRKTVRAAIRSTTYFGKSGFSVGGNYFVRTRRTAEAIANVLKTVTDYETRTQLVDGWIRNEAENMDGDNGWTNGFALTA